MREVQLLCWYCNVHVLMQRDSTSNACVNEKVTVLFFSDSIISLTLLLLLSMPKTMMCMRLTSGHRNHHGLLLLGLTPPSAGAAGAGDNRAFTSTLTTCGAHHKRTCVYGLLQEPEQIYVSRKKNKKNTT